VNPPIRDITQEITQSPSQWTNTTGLPLTIPDGFSCNVCVESDWRRAKMLVANADGKGEYDFFSGFLQGHGAPGRPVDVLFDTKGNIFISDDKAGVIYRVSQT